MKPVKKSIPKQAVKAVKKPTPKMAEKTIKKPAPKKAIKKKIAVKPAVETQKYRSRRIARIAARKDRQMRVGGAHENP